MIHRQSCVFAGAAMVSLLAGCGPNADLTAVASSAATNTDPTPQLDLTRWSYNDVPDSSLSRPAHLACVMSANSADVPDLAGGLTRVNLSLCIKRRADGRTLVTIETDGGAFGCEGLTGCTITVRFDDQGPQPLWVMRPIDAPKQLVAYVPDGVVPRLLSAKALVIAAPFRDAAGTKLLRLNVAGLDAKRMGIPVPTGKIPSIAYGMYASPPAASGAPASVPAQPNGVDAL